MGLFKTDTDPHLMELMSFSRHVSSPREVTPDSSAALDGAPADPSSTLVHRLKDYRNETMYPNKQSVSWLEEDKCYEKSYLSCQRTRSKPEERESFHVGWAVWQKAMPLGLIEIKGGQSTLPAASIFS